MSSVAELTSISASLEELVTRLAAIAEHCAHDGNAALSSELFEVERSLTAGQRRLAKALR